MVHPAGNWLRFAESASRFLGGPGTQLKWRNGRVVECWDITGPSTNVIADLRTTTHAWIRFVVA